MTMYDIITHKGNAAQRIAASRMCGTICRAIKSAHEKDEFAMLSYINEFETFVCAYAIGVYAMYGTCNPTTPMNTADNLTVSHAEQHKIIRYIYKIYEMEMKRK